jgi:hypothetical protein
VAGPTKPELLTFFRAFGRWLDAPNEPAALARLVSLHDAIREAGEARPRVGRPAHLRGSVTTMTIIITEEETTDMAKTGDPRESSTCTKCGATIPFGSTLCGNCANPDGR